MTRGDHAVASRFQSFSCSMDHQLFHGVVGVAQFVDITLVHIGEHRDDEQLQVAGAASLNGALNAAATAVQSKKRYTEVYGASDRLGKRGRDVVVFVVQEHPLTALDQVPDQLLDARRKLE